MESDIGLFEELCNHLHSEGDVINVSKKFAELKTDEELIAFTSQLLETAGMLPSSYNFPSDIENLPKSSRSAFECRKQGNDEFYKKNYHKALTHYTSSIANAPHPELKKENKYPSSELAFGFANRSAVLYCIKCYQGAINDIDYALECNYPEELKYKLYERKGKCLQETGKMIEASKSYVEALQQLSIACNSIPSEKKKLVEKEVKELLTQAIEKSSDQIKLESNVQQKLPEFSHGSNSEISCASDAVKISFSKEWGRFVEATRLINPGDVIAVEKAFCSVLLSDFSMTHCHNCLKRSYSLIPCKFCVSVLFCSEKCRSTAWNKYHSIECALRPSLEMLKIDKLGFLAIRIIMIESNCGRDLKQYFERVQSEIPEKDERKVGFTQDGIYSSTNYFAIHHLITNSTNRSVANLFRRVVTAACIVNVLEKKSNFFSSSIINSPSGHESNNELTLESLKNFTGAMILRFLQSLPCNAHEVSESYSTGCGGITDIKEIGAGAYAFLSLLNHSCDPNVTRHCYDGDTIVLRAIRPIKEGEQIFDNYGYHYAVHDIKERTQHLTSQYLFLCKCPACLNSWPMYEDMKKTNPVFICSQCGVKLRPNPKKIMTACEQCSNHFFVPELNQTLTESSEKFNKFLQEFIAGRRPDNIDSIIEYLKFLNNHVQRPWKEYNDCQEAIKQWYNYEGNYYEDPNK